MAKKINGGFGEFPFATADFTKAWGDFKIPGFDFDAVFSAQRKNIEAVTAANQVAGAEVSLVSAAPVVPTSAILLTRK